MCTMPALYPQEFHDDLVKRDFSADDVNELWLADITEHWTDEGKHLERIKKRKARA